MWSIWLSVTPTFEYQIARRFLGYCHAVDCSEVNKTVVIHIEVSDRKRPENVSCVRISPPCESIPVSCSSNENPQGATIDNSLKICKIHPWCRHQSKVGEYTVVTVKSESFKLTRTRRGRLAPLIVVQHWFDHSRRKLLHIDLSWQWCRCDIDGRKHRLVELLLISCRCLVT